MWGVWGVWGPKEGGLPVGPQSCNTRLVGHAVPRGSLGAQHGSGGKWLGSVLRMNYEKVSWEQVTGGFTSTSYKPKCLSLDSWDTGSNTLRSHQRTQGRTHTTCCCLLGTQGKHTGRGGRCRRTRLWRLPGGLLAGLQEGRAATWGC